MTASRYGWRAFHRRAAARWPVGVLLAVCLLAATAASVVAQERADVAALFVQAAGEQRVGVARKTKAVDVRPARVGEVVVSIIAGEGKETQSPPAQSGDMVVRNRCQETGNEEILVTAAKFAERYDGPASDADRDGWRAYRPRGVEMQYFIVRPADGSFSFMAPWGEAMVARVGDAIVRDPKDVKDTYRIAAAAFRCTYEIVQAPPRP
jgi:hypothetical protein